eukprot:TRINITY_DN2645_c0_g1_i1.p1 TRINITY_DN2645_c0_g1~~TRINITY_DN2645_c0_g1_i1.p1  ORF type:complete len:212 (-),score=23.14 TRINITY_DN2645_c0_g1_i1:27-662(-)
MNNEIRKYAKSFLIALVLFLLCSGAILYLPPPVCIERSGNYSSYSLEEMKEILTSVKLPISVKKLVNRVFDADMEWIIKFEKLGLKITEEEGQIFNPPYCSSLRERLEKCPPMGCEVVQINPLPSKTLKRIPLLTDNDLTKKGIELLWYIYTVERLRPAFDCTPEEAKEWGKLIDGLKACSDKIYVANQRLIEMMTKEGVVDLNNLFNIFF